MASSSDREARKDIFKWSEEDALALCDVCLLFIANHGRKQFFKWKDIQSEVENIIGRKISNTNSCKHKYDTLRKDWVLWRKLKESETGIEWDPVSGKIDAPSLWWQRKIQENKDFQKFRHKGVNAELEDKLNSLFLDSNANGEHDHSPSTELALKGSVVQMKRRKREPAECAIVAHEKPDMKVCVKKLTEGSTTSVSSQPITSTVSSAMQIIKRMVVNGNLTAGSELWCFAITTLEDATRREILCSIEDDAGRLRWIEYLFNLKEK